MHNLFRLIKFINSLELLYIKMIENVINLLFFSLDYRTSIRSARNDGKINKNKELN